VRTALPLLVVGLGIAAAGARADDAGAIPSAADSLVFRRVEQLQSSQRGGSSEERDRRVRKLVALADSLDAAGEPKAASTALQGAGWSQVGAGRLDEARELLDRAEELSRVDGDPEHLANILNTVAISLAVEDRYQEAIAKWSECLELRTEIGDVRGQGQAVGNMANAHSLAGNILEARRLTERAIALDHESGNQVGLASAHHRMAGILRDLGRYDAALASSDSALAMERRLDRDVSSTLVRRAQILFDWGRVDEALTALDAADSAATARGNVRLAESNRGNRAKMLVALGRSEEAVAVCEASDLGRMGRLDRVLFRSFWAMALLDAGRAARAEEMLAVAVEEFERIRDDEESLAETLFDRAGSIYSVMAAVRLAQGRPADAWIALDRGRSMGLRERLGLPAAHPDSVRTALSRAGNAALLELAEPIGSEAHLFVLTRDDLVALEATLPSRERLATARGLLASGAADEECQAVLAAIARPLLGAAVAALSDSVRHVYVVPPAELAGFPLEVLPLPDDPEGRRFGERFSVSYLPGAWLLPELARRTAADGPMIVFADPVPGGDPDTTRAARGPLPWARTEARRVAIDGAEVLLGAQASTGAFDRRAGDGAVLHFATHAELDPFRPDRSGLVLAAREGTGLVSAADVERRHLRADLVTLSGCRTAGGWTVIGEGTLGLPRAFLAAGCRSIVSSLWDVEDEAAARFMDRFYAGLRSEAPPDDALRAARLALAEAGFPLRDRAAFVLTGLGHRPVPILAGASPAEAGPSPRLLAFGGALAALALLGLFLALRARRRS
jgi:tetratricopeptide (TPR) repeat protein